MTGAAPAIIAIAATAETIVVFIEILQQTGDPERVALRAMRSATLSASRPRPPSRSIEIPAPFPSIGWPLNAAHPQAVIFGIASGIAVDDHVIAWLERFARDALL